MEKEAHNKIEETNKKRSGKNEKKILGRREKGNKEEKGKQKR